MGRRIGLFLAVLFLALGPAMDGFASPGRGASIGSRGSRTYVMPPRTPTSPYGAQPFQRTITPPPVVGGPRYGTQARHPFLAGLAGGLIGVGLAHMLFGHGGLMILIEIVIGVLVVRFLLRRLRTGGVSTYAPASGPVIVPVSIGRADYAAFESLLREVTRAWTMGDLAALGRVATPEMVGIFGDQIRELGRRGLRNSTTDVRLEKGDLAEAWREGPEEYATVAMRFSAIDIDTDATGRVTSGDPATRITRNEVWSFVRRSGGPWILSAIQQA
jgi:predicted lipid-binding transport protein (Tim44 family)